jgi:beta-fructofuranosidase
MKRYILIAISVIIIFSHYSVYSQTKNGIVGYWSFDESKGKIAVDKATGISDSIHYIFNTEKPLSDPIRRKGISEVALEFDGFSSWIKRNASSFVTPTEDLTISVWVAPRAFEHGDSGRLSAIVNQENLKNKTGFVLGMFRFEKWSFQIGTGEKWFEGWDEEHPLPRRQWSYLVATYEASEGKMTLYMTGDPVFQKTLFQKLPIKPADKPLLIGVHNQSVMTGRSSQAMPLNAFNGLMDELIIYNRELSASEVKESYQNYLTALGGRFRKYHMRI